MYNSDNPHAIAGNAIQAACMQMIGGHHHAHVVQHALDAGMQYLIRGWANLCSLTITHTLSRNNHCQNKLKACHLKPWNPSSSAVPKVHCGCHC
jgi:hypothetical protein